MARKKLSKKQLQKCMEKVTDSEKLVTKVVNMADGVLDSKYQLSVEEAERVFLKCSEDKSMLSHLLTEIQNIGKNEAK